MPSGLSVSAWRSVTAVPAGPLTLSRHQPTMFWPMSKMNTPGFGSVTAIGLSVSMTRIGSIIWADDDAAGRGDELRRLPRRNRRSPRLLQSVEFLAGIVFFAVVFVVGR